LFDLCSEKLKWFTEFERLKPTKRLFYYTVKMLVYRAETAIPNSVKPLLERDEDSKALIIRQLSKSHADESENILNVKVHDEKTGIATKKALKEIIPNLMASKGLFFCVVNR
jgi:hypothetical protein